MSTNQFPTLKWAQRKDKLYLTINVIHSKTPTIEIKGKKMKYEGTDGTKNYSFDIELFDEIDTGVGGVTAQKMAEKLALISKEGQVLCITHLAQIAAFADRHIRILKETEGGRTSTRLSVLDHDGKIQELVRMTAGEHMTKAAVANAEVLLDAAEAFKKARGIIGGCK